MLAVVASVNGHLDFPADTLAMLVFAGPDPDLERTLLIVGVASRLTSGGLVQLIDGPGQRLVAVVDLDPAIACTPQQIASVAAQVRSETAPRAGRIRLGDFHWPALGEAVFGEMLAAGAAGRGVLQRGVCARARRG